MELAEIISSIRANRVNITQHARKEAKEDGLPLDAIYFATRNGEVIEVYPEDTPYPSCLVYGQTSDGDAVHSVWAYDAASQIAILITVYRPDPDRWIDWKVRRER